MYISFGTGYSDTTQFGQEMCSCSNCNEKKVFVQTGRKYFHLMSIPLLPLGQHYEAWCRNCSTEYNLENAPSPSGDYIQKMVKSGSFAWWVHPASIIFILAIIGIVIFANS